MLSTSSSTKSQNINTKQDNPSETTINNSQDQRESLTSRFRLKKPGHLDNNYEINNNSGTSSFNFTPTDTTLQNTSSVMINDHSGKTDSEDGNKHSYSCKRCRRLKKKCTRTIPECQNCAKAGESCEYVPRAPRRKKSEILRSLQEERQNEQNRSPLSSTPVLRTQDSNLQFASNNSFPKINPLQPLGVSQFSTTTSSVRSLEPFGSQQPQAQQIGILENSPRSYNLGTTDPFSYKTNLNSAALPPLSSITTNISNQAQQHQQPQAQTNASFLRFSPPATRQGSDDSQNGVQQLVYQTQQQQHPQNTLLSHPFSKSPVLDGSSKPLTQGSLQNRLLASVLGNGDMVEAPTMVTRPNLEVSFMIELINRFFTENYHSYPFLNQAAIINFVMSSNINRLDSLPASDSFEIFMIMFIGYCSLERVGKINTDIHLKKYLISKSIEQTNDVITFDNIESIKFLLLLGIYSLFDTAGSTSWHIAGNINRLILSLGLNRINGFKSRDSNNHATRDREQRYRVFWSAYNFDRLVSISLGRPFGIHDDDINIPFPNKFEHEEIYDIELITAIISLRQIEGKILKNVHSVNSGHKVNDDATKLEILKTLRIEVEDWFNLTNTLTSHHHSKDSIYNVSWFTSHYYQLTMLLYRPSFLIPKPSKETLLILGKSCLQCLAYTYNLHTSHLLQPNWVTVYRFLTQCTTIVYCLCHWCIDLVESKTEMNLCIEILESFGDRWPVSAKSAQIFKEINRSIYDVKVNQNWELLGAQELTNKFFEASRAYHDVLSSNNVDIWFDDPVIVNSEQQQQQEFMRQQYPAQ